MHTSQMKYDYLIIVLQVFQAKHPYYLGKVCWQIMIN